MGWRREVLLAINALIDNHRPLKLSSTALTDLRDLKDDLDDPFTLLITGEFKSGKSSFVNAILGTEVLISDVVPATAILTKIRYGIRAQLVVFFNDGKKGVFPLDLLQQLTSETPEGIGLKLRPNINMVVVELPLDMLKLVTIVDSPGLEAGMDRHSEMTERFLTRADYVIWVFDFLQVGKASEMKMLQRFKSIGIPVAGIINKIDLLNPEEEAWEDYYDFVTRRLEGHVTHLYGFSASSAQQGRDKNDETLLELSNLRVVTDLVRSIVQEPNYKIKRTLSRLSSHCQLAYLRLMEVRPELPNYSDLLVPLSEKDYPAILDNIEGRDTKLQRINELQAYILSLVAESDKTVEELYHSLKGLHKSMNEDGTLDNNMMDELHGLIEIVNGIIINTHVVSDEISSYQAKKYKLESWLETLSKQWLEIKDAKLFKKKKTVAFLAEFEKLTLEHNEINQAYRVINSKLLISKGKITDVYERVNVFLMNVMNDLQREKDSVCTRWAFDLMAIQQKYNQYSIGEINGMLVWLQLLESIAHKFSRIDMGQGTVESADYAKHQFALDELATNYSCMMPLIEKLKFIHTLSEVEAGSMTIKKKLQPNMIAREFGLVIPIPDYTPEMVIKRIKRNQWISTIVFSAVLVGAVYWSLL